ncbi:MAG: TolC family protein [Desulfobacterales bacterium]|nr:TolC family protein [Desulfobacterales bacterium]
MKKLITWMCFAGVLFLSAIPSAAAQESEAYQFENNITLSKALNYAVQNNPRIKGLIAKWEAQIEKYREKTGLPDPMINITYFPSPIETRLGPQDYNVTLSQGVPFPGKLGKKGTVAEKEIAVARLKLDREINNIHAQIVKSYAELSYIREAKKITYKNMELIDALTVQAEQTYARDNGLLMDIMRANSQKGQLQYDLILLNEIEKSQEADLNSLMNRPPDAPFGEMATLAVRPVVLSREEILAKALENNDAVKISQAMVDRADAIIDLAETTSQPDFKFGLFYAGIGESDMNIEDSGKDAVGIQFGITIPLWSGKNNGKKLATLHEKKAALAQKTETQNQIQAMISKTLFKMENASRLITLYKDELLPQAMNSMNTVELWFKENQTAFSDFLEAQSVVHNFQLAIARARADYIKTLADLENLAGTTLVAKESTNEH